MLAFKAIKTFYKEYYYCTYTQLAEKNNKSAIWQKMGYPLVSSMDQAAE